LQILQVFPNRLGVDSPLVCSLCIFEFNADFDNAFNIWSFFCKKTSYNIGSRCTTFLFKLYVWKSLLKCSFWISNVSKFYLHDTHVKLV